MKSTLSNVFIFTAGVVIGSAVTWKFVKTKYEQISREEIDSVKEYYASRQGEPTKYEDTDECEDTPFTAMSDVSELNDKLKEQGYAGYEEVMEEMGKPYVISPEEFGEMVDEGYETISLIYYADKVLTDDDNELVEDVENTVGTESLTHFGEYEDDSVFVRNDRLKADYEILLDTRNYSDVVNKNPHPMEEE